MKKEIKIVAIVLVVLMVFLAGFGLGATKGININVKYEGAAEQAGATTAATTVATTVATTAATTVATTAATTAADNSADTTTAADNSADTTTAADNSANSGALSVPSTPAEIAAAYNKAINDMRAASRVTVKKHDIITVEVANLPSAVQGVVENLTKTEPQEWTFENGVDVNDPNRKLIEKTIPWGREATVQEAGLASASATPNADGGYTMVITFVPEDSTFDGTTNTSEPTYHMGAMDPLNLGSLDLGPITITNASLHYPGATCTATVDSEGRLVKLEQKLPLEGSGTGKLGLSITLELSGSMDGNYEFIYG